MPEPVSFCNTMMAKGMNSTAPTFARSPGREIENE